ncbi:MAG: glucose 1-dehydrogenase [Alphaproteobacteria bacterium]|nr:glucose 1-dehydrogenase [Alphaproteobacteria bacterium]
MARLADKVAIVTGGGLGIGKATAKKFATEGATVVVTDVNANAGRGVAEEIGESAVFLGHDVTDESEWEAVMKETVDRFGKVDILVNNAGILGTGAPQSPEDLSLDEVHAISKVNVDGVLLGCKHAIRAMKDRGGAIVNLSSIAGIYAVPALVPYGASKGAVRQLTKSVAAYCGKQGYGIRCNSVHPGIIETAMGETVLNFIFDDPEQGREERRQGIPLGRLGQAEDIANAVCYLASDEASFVNGAELVVDGGQIIQ